LKKVYSYPECYAKEAQGFQGKVIVVLL